MNEGRDERVAVISQEEGVVAQRTHGQADLLEIEPGTVECRV